MAITYTAGASGQALMYGLSTDTKPTPAQSGWSFIEVDTGKTLKGNGSNWICTSDSQYTSSSGTTGLANQVWLSSGTTQMGGLGIVDLKRHVDGLLHPSKMGTGSGGATKFLREDNTWQTVSASAASYNPNLYITTADQTITANYSICFPSEYEIGSGFVTTLNAGSILQIT